MNYRIAWLIDIEAADPVEAAQKALNIQRDKNSIATCFIVEDKTQRWYIDLGEEHVKAIATPH